MTSVVTTRRSARVKVDRGVRRETITIHQGADALELEVRLYRVKRVIVLREIGERDALSAVSLIEEIVLELMGRYGEAMDEARIFLYQPVQMWTTRSRYLEWRARDSRD